MPESSQTSARRRGGRTAEPLDSRILRLTDRTGDCWLWTGALDPYGYGRITVKQRPMKAHRVSYETFVGSLAAGLEIDHLCRVRHCVKPEHLDAVTHSVNVQRQMAATGTIAGRRLGGLQLGESCREGHLIDEENAYQHRGLISCLTCRRERNRLHAADGKPRQRTYTDHAKVAAKARKQPGEWTLAKVTTSADTAYHSVHYIRSGTKLAAYRPAGSFDAKSEKVDGSFRIFVRFVGSDLGGAA